MAKVSPPQGGDQKDEKKKAEQAEKAAALLVITLEPISEMLQKCVDELKSLDGVDVVSVGQPMQVLALLRRARFAFIIVDTSDQSQILPQLQIFKAIKKRIVEGNIKVLLRAQTRFMIPAVLKKYESFGVNDMVTETVKQRALSMKLDRAVKVLLKKKESFEKHLAYKAEQKSQRAGLTYGQGMGGGGAKAPETKVAPPLKLRCDCWLKEGGEIKFVSGRWLIRLKGPSLFFGKWEEIETKDAKDRQWQWVFDKEKTEMFGFEEGTWIFRGHRPELRAGFWSFVGKNPLLVFRDSEGNTHERIKEDDDKNLVVRRDAPLGPRVLGELRQYEEQMIKEEQDRKQRELEEQRERLSKKRKKKEEDEKKLPVRNFGTLGGRWTYVAVDASGARWYVYIPREYIAGEVEDVEALKEYWTYLGSESPYLSEDRKDWCFLGVNPVRYDGFADLPQVVQDYIRGKLKEDVKSLLKDSDKQKSEEDSVDRFANEKIKKEEDDDPYVAKGDRKKSKELEAELDRDGLGTELNYEDTDEKGKGTELDYQDKKDGQGTELDFTDEREKSGDGLDYQGEKDAEGGELDYQGEKDGEGTELDFKDAKKKEKRPRPKKNGEDPLAILDELDDLSRSNDEGKEPNNGINDDLAAGKNEAAESKPQADQKGTRQTPAKDDPGLTEYRYGMRYFGDPPGKWVSVVGMSHTHIYLPRPFIDGEWTDVKAFDVYWILLKGKSPRKDESTYEWVFLDVEPTRFGTFDSLDKDIQRFLLKLGSRMDKQKREKEATKEKLDISKTPDIKEASDKEESAKQARKKRRKKSDEGAEAALDRALEELEKNGKGLSPAAKEAVERAQRKAKSVAEKNENKERDQKEAKAKRRRPKKDGETDLDLDMDLENEDSPEKSKNKDKDTVASKGPDAFMAEEVPGPTLEPLSLAYLMSELMIREGEAPDHVGNRFCAYLSASTGGLRSELWSQGEKGWSCLGTDDETEGKYRSGLEQLSPGFNSVSSEVVISYREGVGAIVLAGEGAEKVAAEYLDRVCHVAVGFMQSKVRREAAA